jgi:hypothetical protein
MLEHLGTLRLTIRLMFYTVQPFAARKNTWLFLGQVWKWAKDAKNA